MSECQECGSNRIFTLSAKSSDLNFWNYHGHEHDGYLPYINNVCGGDYTDIIVCLECGQLQGKWPVEGPQREDDDYCPECGEGLPLDIDPTQKYVCTECGFIVYKGPKPEPEPRGHGGNCEVQVPTRKCRLLVPVEFAGFEVGHELYIEGETSEFFHVNIMHNRVELMKGVEAEEISADGGVIRAQKC